MINEIINQIRKNAVAFPNQIAIRYQDEMITYRQFELETNYIAKVISNRIGNKKQRAIIIYRQRGIRFIEYMIGVLKCGCYYVPIENDIPYKRVEYICKDICAELILSEEDFTVNGLSSIDIECKEEKNFQIRSISENDLVYVMYTSGTSGVPKGVRIMYRNLINLVYSFYNILYNRIKSQSNIGLLASLSFDASVKQIYNAFYYGHTLVISESKVKYFGRKIHDFHNKYGIDICDVTPTILDIMTQQKCKVFSPVKVFLVGGENLKWTTIQRYIEFVNLCPEFINVYGPTECCVDVTYFSINKDCVKESTGFVPIGRPLLNTEIWIVDECGRRITKSNMVGEIVVVGEQVGAGYENIESAKFSRMNGKNMYHTGDLASYIDGQIIVCGRADEQIKIHGHRIELSEINQLVEQYWKCSCYTFTHCVGSAEKIQIYACKSYDLHEERELLEFLRLRLPSYMIPSKFFYGEMLPMTNRGKVDKQKLFDIIFDEKETET